MHRAFFQFFLFFVLGFLQYFAVFFFDAVRFFWNTFAECMFLQFHRGFHLRYTARSADSRGHTL